MKTAKRKKKKNIWRENINAAFEGLKLSYPERMELAWELFKMYKTLTPYKYRPIVKAFNTFSEYNAWKKKQKNPWYW